MARTWPNGGGATGELFRTSDWSHSPLGPPEAWPPALRSVVSLLLHAKLPMFVAWGAEFGFLYNDAYAEILGDKHPRALGGRFHEVWAEFWPDIGPLVRAAMRGIASYREDQPLIMNRRGVDELAWFTFSYSPLEDETGHVAGMFCGVVETTARVRENQRRAFLMELDDRLRDERDADRILVVSAELLGRRMGVDRAHWVTVDAPQDRFDVGPEWTRAGAPGLSGPHRLSDFDAAVVRQLAAGGLVIVDDSLERLGAAAEPAERAAGPRLRGALCAPLLRSGVWRGVLCVNTREPRRWREDEQELIREVAERVWTRAERAIAEARVRDSEQRFRALVNATSDMVYRMNPDWTEMRQLDGRGLLTDTDSPRIAWLDLYIPADEQPRVRAAIDEAVTTGGVFELEHRVHHADGGVGWTWSRAVPHRDACGEIVEWFGAATDVTDAHRAREAMEEAAERLALATEAAEVGFWDLDVTTDILVWPPRVKQMFGIPADQPISMADFYAGLHPRDHDRVAAAFRAAVDPAQRALYDVEYRTVGREDGRVRWVAAKGRAIFDEKGRCVRVLGTAIDISVRKAAEEHLRLMVNELNHRVKNSLATVQAITTQTLRRGEVPDSVRDALTARLVALAEAHDVLTDEKWSGAELADLLAQAAAPFVSLHGASPFEIHGPRVFLPPKTAIAMALAFHELATNAAKYGALSTADGRVQISWTVVETAAGRELTLTWRETGGPPVAAPVRSGFGTRLIQRGLASELRGAVSLDYLPAGLVCVMDALLPDEEAEGWTIDLQAG